MTDASIVRYYKKDFWSRENPKYEQPHHRLEKSARIVNAIAGSRECALLDVGCGPATLAHLLRPNIDYFGIDISLMHPAPNLLEADIVETPITFGGRHFDIVVAQGLFEYIGSHQEQKFSEIAGLLEDHGTFLVSYVNFGHHRRSVYWPYSNVQPIGEFRASLSRHFTVVRSIPTSHNWTHAEPRRRLVRAGNMLWNVHVPFVSPRLAVEYFFVCTSRN